MYTTLVGLKNLHEFDSCFLCPKQYQFAPQYIGTEAMFIFSITAGFVNRIKLKLLAFKHFIMEILKKKNKIKIKQIQLPKHKKKGAKKAIVQLNLFIGLNAYKLLSSFAIYSPTRMGVYINTFLLRFWKEIFMRAELSVCEREYIN